VATIVSLTNGRLFGIHNGDMNNGFGNLRDGPDIRPLLILPVFCTGHCLLPSLALFLFLDTQSSCCNCLTANMSSNIAPTAASANQALLALLDQLNDMVEQVLRSQSEEEKMGLSRTIASEMVCFTFYVLRILIW
jgi:hypothetical protein